MDFLAIILYVGKNGLEFASMLQQHALASIPESYSESKIKRPTQNERIVFYIEKLWWPKNLSEELHDKLNAVTKYVNSIKARPLNQRLFSCLCDEMDADHTGLLLLTEVRWLSRGRVLKRVFELREKTISFLNKQKNVSIAERLTKEKFIANIAYMSDIFHSLHCLKFRQ